MCTVVRYATESATDDLMEYAVIILIAGVIEHNVEGLATTITGCTVRGLTLAKECVLEGHTTDETQ